MEQSEASCSKLDKWEVKYPWYDPLILKVAIRSIFIHVIMEENQIS